MPARFFTDKSFGTDGSSGAKVLVLFFPNTLVDYCGHEGTFGVKCTANTLFQVVFSRPNDLCRGCGQHVFPSAAR